MVIGRRGSKTIIASVITSYEAYKLMVIGDGDPHKFYGLPADDPIAIINVALSQDQAGILFTQIQNRIRGAPIFNGRIAASTTSEIHLYTDTDLKKKQKGASINIPGSILILCGHSNPDSLRGRNAVLLLFDELAFYDDRGKVTGKKMYNSLKPSLAHFYKYGDGRLVEISSPSTPSGIFYEIFVNSKKYNHILSFQLPTWCINETIDYDHPDLKVERESNLDNFIIEFGAQWANSGTFGMWFPEQLVDRAIKTGLTPHEAPYPRMNYYLHVDPALSGDVYAAVLVAKYPYLCATGKKRIRVVLAGIWTWSGKSGIGLQFSEIDKEILKIYRKYSPVIVSYDQWNSVHSLQFLKSNGVRTAQISFNRGFKQKIYQNLKDLMSYSEDSDLWLYNDHRLISELKNIKFRPTARGVGFVVNKSGDVKTDDLVDCLAGASAWAAESVRPPLPAPVTVHSGFR